jgi:hypothetical protein
LRTQGGLYLHDLTATKEIKPNIFRELNLDLIDMSRKRREKWR